MAVTEIGDPRLQSLFGAIDPRDGGVRPIIRLPRRSLAPVVLTAIAAVFAAFLFLVLKELGPTAGKQKLDVVPDSSAPEWPTPPALYVPPLPEPITAPPAREQSNVPAAPPLPAQTPAKTFRPAISEPIYLPQAAPLQAAPQPRISAGPPLVIDVGTMAGTPSPPAARVAASSLGASREPLSRMRASALANPSMTIVQGTVIQAVLETAFNSTQAGFVRAVVSRNVHSFDGTNLLVPRGSKLIGEYNREVGAGQKRAMIVWTRLISPDGMTINLDSPAVDLLGRSGVPSSVNTHFMARLGDALLQSFLGIGTAVAQRSLVGPIVVTQGQGLASTQTAQANNYVPTLTAPAGKSISVFVAHDLDFGVFRQQ